MPRVGEDSTKKLFVGGLNYETEDKGLREYFERFGELADYVVMRFPDSKRSRGFGFVTFERADCLEHCMSSQPHTIDGRTIELKRATPREDGGGSGGGGGGGYGKKRSYDDEETPVDPEDRLMRKLFIGGLSYNTNEDSMKEYFEKFGKLDDAVIMKFPDTGRSRGFGFITFEKAFMVDDCQRGRPHVIDGKTVECKRATPKSDAKRPEAQASVKKLYVGNLTEEMADSDLQDYFSKFGTVDHVEQMKWNDTQKKRGFGFIEFDDYDAVDKICLLNRHFLLGKRLEVRKALSKQEMSIIKKAKMSEDWNRSGGQMDMGHGMGHGMGMGGMNPMMMMNMMMTMMNQMGGANNASSGAAADTAKSYAEPAKKEPSVAKSDRGFGAASAASAGGYGTSGYNSAGGYGSSGYGTGATGYSGYSADGGSAAGGGTGGSSDMMANMANMMGMNWGSNMGWGSGGATNGSQGSGGGGPVRGGASGARDASAPYSSRR